MAMYDDPADTRRRKNIVPRSRSFFPAASQFIGGVNHPAVEAMNRPQSEWGTPAAGARLGRKDLTTYQLPSGGFATVKSGGKIPRGARVFQVGNQLPVDYEGEKARGYGAPSPFPLTGGFLARGGIGVPAEQLTPQERSQYGFSGEYGQTFGEKFAGQHPSLSGGLSLLGQFGTLGYNAIASLFRGGQQQNQPSQNFYAYNPSPVPMQPRRYFDF